MISELVHFVNLGLEISKKSFQARATSKGVLCSLDPLKIIFFLPCCAGQLCGGNFAALFVSTDHVDQKAICIVAYPCPCVIMICNERVF